VAKLLKDNFVLLKLNAFHGEQFDFGREIGHDHNPGILVFTPDGALISHTQQVMSVEKLLKILKDIMLARQPLKDAKKGHKEKPQEPRANFALGCALFNTGKKDKDAARHLNRFLELDKENKEKLGAQAHFRLGVIALRAKKSDGKKAGEHFRKAVELDKDGRLRMKERVDWEKVIIFQKAKNPAKLKAAARKHVDGFAKSVFAAKALMIIADICLKQKDIDGAVDAWLELQKKRFGSIEYPEMRKLLAKYWNQSSQSKRKK